MIQRATILYFMKSFQFQCLQDQNVRLSIDRNMKIWSWKAEVLIQTKLFWFEQECVPSSKMTPSVAVLATSRWNGGLKGLPKSFFHNFIWSLFERENHRMFRSESGSNTVCSKLQNPRSCLNQINLVGTRLQQIVKTLADLISLKGYVFSHSI
jgi:hypothetical protein